MAEADLPGRSGDPLGIPHDEPWTESLSGLLRSRGAGFFVLVWFPAFVVLQSEMFGWAMGVHGAGFDDCDSTVLSGEVVLPSTAELGVFGLVAVAGTAALALWRLRGWALLAALCAVAVSAMAWAVLLIGEQTC